MAPSSAPLTLNPVFTWLGLREQLTANDAPIVLTGFFLCVLFLVVLLCFHWLGQVVSRSSGCSLWEQWGGNVKRMIPLSRRKSMSSTDTWLSWLSNNSNPCPLSFGAPDMFDKVSQTLQEQLGCHPATRTAQTQCTRRCPCNHTIVKSLPGKDQAWRNIYKCT